MASNWLKRTESEIVRDHFAFHLELELKKYMTLSAVLICAVDVDPNNDGYLLSVIVSRLDQPPMRLVHPMRRLNRVPDELIAQLMMIG